MTQTPDTQTTTPEPMTEEDIARACQEWQEELIALGQLRRLPCGCVQDCDDFMPCDCGR